MTWDLISADRKLSVDLNAGDNGSLSGNITFNGERIAVSGGWSAAGSIPGRGASAFSFCGRTNPPSDVPMWIAASGTMAGPGTKPTGIDIRLTASSSADGAHQPYSATLTPNRTPYLVAQAQLMQDWVSESGAIIPISGYRVIIASKDFEGNPLKTRLHFSFAHPADSGDLHFTDGVKRSIVAGGAIEVDTDHDGELSFVIDAQGQLSCPPLKVAAAAFMAAGHSLIVSPDRHVHATLANLTGEQLRGREPLASGKLGAALKTTTNPSPTADQLNGVAAAIAHTMSACTEHTLQATRPTVRDARAPLDTQVLSPYFPSYQRPTGEPYHFASNTIGTYFLEHDIPVTRIAIPEKLRTPLLHLNFQTGAVSTSPPPIISTPQSVVYQDNLALLFAGRTNISVTLEQYLTAVTASDDRARKRDLSAIWGAIKSAVSVTITTVGAAIEGAATVVEGIAIAVVDEAANVFHAVIHSIEDAVGFVGALFDKIGAAIEDVINFVKAVFNLDDIRRTADVLESLLTQVPAVIDTALSKAKTTLKNDVEAIRDYINKRLDTELAKLGPKGTMNGQTAAQKAEPPGNIHSKYFTSHFSGNIKKATSSGVPAFADVPNFSDTWSARFDVTKLTSMSQGLAAKPPRFFSQNILDSAFSSILQDLRALVNEFLDLIESGVDAVFSFIQKIVEAIFELATKRIDIPFFTSFYETVIRDAKEKKTCNILGISCLIGAVGFNAIYRLVDPKSKWVIPDAQVAEISKEGFLKNALAPASTRTTPVSPASVQMGQWITSAGFAATTIVWGIFATWEDLLWEPGVPIPDEMKFVTTWKMVGQTLTFMGSLTSQILTEISTPPNPAMITLTSINTLCDVAQMASNYAVMKIPAWDPKDPFFTGVLGVVQLLSSFSMIFVPGGTSILGTVSNMAQACEWIPQLLKSSGPELKPEIVIVDAFAYGITAAVTLIELEQSVSNAPS